MKKTKSLRVIACAAVCAALSIVLGKFAAIPIGNTIRISFENLPIIFCSVAFGPVRSRSVASAGRAAPSPICSAVSCADTTSIR